MLKDTDHKFYLYLLSKNFEDEVEAFRSFYSRFDEETALYYIIYSLEFSINKNAPYNFVLNGKILPVKTGGEISDLLRKNPSLGKSLERDKGFRIWLYVKDGNLFNEFDAFTVKHKKSERLGRLLPYFFAEEMIYKGLKGNACRSLEEIGEEIAQNYDEYKRILRSNSSEIYYFLEAKDYTGEIEFYQKAFNMEFASSKPAPYNEDIALCKIIKGSGYNMPFETSAGAVSSPEELLGIYTKAGKDLKPQLEDANSFLHAWLSVFYHEAPLNEDGTMYIYYLEDYKTRLKEYLNYLEKLERSLSLVKRYKEGLKKTDSIENYQGAYNKRTKIEKFFTYAIPFVSAAILFVYLLFNESELPLNIFDISFWYFIAWAIGTSAWLLWNGYESGNLEISTSCVGGPIIGVVVGAAAYYIFWLVISVPLFLGAVLALTGYYLHVKLRNLNYEYPREPDSHSY